jgi:hypothetical protein
MNLLHIDPSNTNDDHNFDAVTVIVEALRAKFGNEALAVARIQQSCALPESDDAWAEIVMRLSA